MQREKIWMSCAYNLRIVRFGTWFTPLLEGSFIAGCKEARTDLHLSENSWLPPHRSLFYFPKILVPNLTTKTNYQAPVKNYRQSSQAIAAEISHAFGMMQVSGRPGSGNQVLGLCSGCSCLGSNCWRKRISSQRGCYTHMLQTLRVENVVSASTEPIV